MFVRTAEHIWAKKMQQCINLKMAISLKSQSYITTDSQLASLSWVPSGTRDQFFSSFLELFLYSYGFVGVGCPL
jgi:hypothetical protein